MSVFICVVINRGQQRNTTNLEEIIWSSPCDVWFTATRGRIELEAKNQVKNIKKTIFKMFESEFLQ